MFRGTSATDPRQIERRENEREPNFRTSDSGIFIKKKKKKKIDMKNEFVIVASFFGYSCYVGPYAWNDVWICADILEN